MGSNFALNRTNAPAMHYGLTDLKIFLAVAEEGNLSRGAGRAHLAASSVSQRIKGLEDAVGTQLLTRHARGVTLTPAGHIMLEHTRQCLAQLEQMNADLLPYSQRLTSHVNLFASNVAINSFLPKDLARFFALYPSVRITLEDKLSLDIPAAVAAGRVDIGVCAFTVGHEELEFLPYRHDQLVLLTHVDSELGMHGSVSFASCANQPFVTPQLGSTLHTFLMAKAASLGMRLDVRVQVAGYDAIARMVASGAGIGVLPRSALSVNSYDQTRIIELSDSWARHDIRVCVRRESIEKNIYQEKLVEVLCSQPT